MNYPTSIAEVEALPEAPTDARLFMPILGVGQITRVDSEDGKTIVICGQMNGQWMKQTIDASVKS